MDLTRIMLTTTCMDPLPHLGGGEKTKPTFNVLTN